MGYVISGMIFGSFITLVFVSMLRLSQKEDLEMEYCINKEYK